MEWYWCLSYFAYFCLWSYLQSSYLFCNQTRPHEVASGCVFILTSDYIFFHVHITSFAWWLWSKPHIHFSLFPLIHVIHSASSCPGRKRLRKCAGNWWWRRRNTPKSSTRWMICVLKRRSLILGWTRSRTSRYAALLQAPCCTGKFGSGSVHGNLSAGISANLDLTSRLLLASARSLRTPMWHWSHHREPEELASSGATWGHELT